MWTWKTYCDSSELSHGMDYRITGAVFKICGAAAKQNQGEKGNFVLSKADTELNMKRDVELVLTPFSLDFADHRIQKRLFTELVKSAQNEEMFLETQRINCGTEEIHLSIGSCQWVRIGTK